jgi:hypothetical protein
MKVKMKKNWDNMFESELWYTGLEPFELVTKNMKTAAKSNSVLDVGCRAMMFTELIFLLLP